MTSGDMGRVRFYMTLVAAFGLGFMTVAAVDARAATPEGYTVAAGGETRVALDLCARSVTVAVRGSTVLGYQILNARGDQVHAQPLGEPAMTTTLTPAASPASCARHALKVTNPGAAPASFTVTLADR